MKPVLSGSSGCRHGSTVLRCVECLQINFERTIRRTLKTLKAQARKARSDAREHARPKHKNYERATSCEAMAVAYDAAASILVQDYSFLKVMKK